MVPRVGYEFSVPHLHDDRAKLCEPLGGQPLDDVAVQLLEAIADKDRVEGVLLERFFLADGLWLVAFLNRGVVPPADHVRSEEHTSELQSRQYLVCRLLLEKKKKKQEHIN